jgi:uncharacterized iron-regulated protein
MTNQETQLELDLGMLTVAQQERVDSFIQNQKNLIQNNIKNSNAIETLLNEGGFIKGVDYENTIKTKIVTEVKEFYCDGNFKTDITYETVDGNISILYKKYDSRENKIVTQRGYVSKNSDKLECSYITPQYRAYKPKSLYEKLLENNSKAQNEFDSDNRERLVVKYTVNKYKNLFPKAEVTVGRDYYKNYRSNYIEFPIVMVKFESGSYISFRMGFEIDEEVVYKKHDAVTSQLSAIELLNIFNQQ